METNLFGCTLELLSRHTDSRGSLVPVWDGSYEARYMYYSWTHPGCCRDADRWHVHQVQTDHFTCAYGNLIVALSDGTELREIVLQHVDPKLLTIPPGVYHCFKNYWSRDSLLLNFPDREYNPEDEGRVPFDEIGVTPW